MAVDEYRIGAGDVVKVLVYEQPDLTTTAKVSVTGTIAMPLLGGVAIAGKTTVEAQRLIGDQLQKGGFVKFPQVVVAVEQVVSQQVAILGQVKKPGKFPVEGPMSLIDLLALAGGTADDASEVATVVRGEGAKKQVTRVNLAKFFAGDIRENMSLSAGDVVMVPKMEVFYIYGEVRRPGAYRLEQEMTVVQALSVGGGLSDRGTQRGIRIKRRDEKGQVGEIEAGLNESLRPNDVIYVKESFL